ncbi:MAG: hypothetical protein QN720_10660 [Nitrososphaeraceae archaeon]|nr:hypothetical protein [Nitrososphaeraceae archaeon]
MHTILKLQLMIAGIIIDLSNDPPRERELTSLRIRLSYVKEDPDIALLRHSRVYLLTNGFIVSNIT